MKRFRRLLIKAFFLIPAIVLVIVIRLLRPWVCVRLCEVDIGRIGGITPLDWYLAERQAGHHQHMYDVFYAGSSTGIGNRQWLKMWQRSCRISKLFRLGQLVSMFNRLLPGWKAHVISFTDVIPSYYQPYTGAQTAKYIINRREPSIQFSAEEEAAAAKELKELIPDDRPFICFHARDSAYLSKVSSKRNWNYHDFRDSDINNYIPAAEELARRGYYALRVGSIVEKKIESSHQLVIDYAASSCRTELLDIYLGAKCHFFICSDTGMSIFSEMFRRPIVFVNWTALLRLPSFYVLNGLIIPKKLYLRNEKRFPSFKEIIESEMGSAVRAESYAKHNIELIENTPEEITAVSLEMEARLNGTWKTSAEDEELQQQFWRMFDPYKVKNPGVRIGAHFLRKNKILLTQSELCGDYPSTRLLIK